MDNQKNNQSEDYKKMLMEKAQQQYKKILENINKKEKSSSDEKFVSKNNIVQKAASYGKSIISRGITNKKATEESQKLRYLSCHGSDELQLSPCSDRKNSEKFENSFYCGACGCGDKKGTQLVNILVDGKEQYSKLDYPTVNCPLKMPGFSNYVPFEQGVSENSRKKVLEDKFTVEYIKEHSK